MAPATKAKKAGKENAPPKMKVIEPVETEEDDSFGDMSAAEPLKVTSSVKPASKTAPRPRKEDEEEESARPMERRGPSGESSRKPNSLAAENDRLRKQRDEYAKQFDELTRIRNTETEKLFEKQKQNAEVQAKAQNDIIANLTELVEKQSARNAELQKSKKQLEAAVPAVPAAAPAPAPAAVAAPAPPPSDLNKSDLKELKALREEVAKLRAGVKEKDQKISQLEKEYQAEIQQSRSLQASTRGAPGLSASTSIPPQTEESEKDAVCLSFYEDMTELQIVNVKLRRDPKIGKEATLNCLHTNHEQKRSLQFKLRTYQELSQDLVAQKAENPWVRMVHYQPENLANETDKELVKRLGCFAGEFTIERKQLGTMWEDLKAKVSGEESDDEE